MMIISLSEGGSLPCFSLSPLASFSCSLSVNSMTEFGDEPSFSLDEEAELDSETVRSGEILCRGHLDFRAAFPLARGLTGSINC
jgi:hypothetical protein